MFSQSLFAQLARMTVLLCLTLLAVHQSPRLMELLAEQAINSGCHQQSHDMSGDHSHHHHH
ncbi:hypothetical protein L1D31_05060 [Vibrio sp. Isolate23]|uniref:hypothetical protein n=1 Tax=Vibrio sp. Isolate23 TaxID=2908533 RepID=UPI001EFC4285|nr:hypothetical protein [Vibrio sp. Isolate23]MCG9681934.1 hypothetical protein [Vibrio sp. Isolate23]